MREKKDDAITFTQIMLDIVAIGISFIALIVSILPQFIPWNSNKYDRANAGDVEAQMFLAGHFFEIGDYNEAIYWYKIASSEEGKYKLSHVITWDTYMQLHLFLRMKHLIIVN